MKGYRVFDDFLPDPARHRARALTLEYKTYAFPEATFHGIAIPPEGDVALALAGRFPGATPTLSFFRKSPEGQTEPHFIHTDVDMGDWTALLYLNPDPPAGDGTVFWEHVATGERENAAPHLRSVEGRSAEGWKPWRRTAARFNRMLLFPATYFHSRAIFANWGDGDGARLTQVTFGRGDLPL
ncbi:MAG TPA: hypothetical protein VGR63_02545 [Casimicrobiaceae bacterium]|jgi:hypothetical protein|nr:hypothetical protein [Casimicrobiaceae bacterium]